MNKSLFRITVALLFLFGMPILIPIEARPNPAIPDNWTTHLPIDSETTTYFWGFSGKSKDRREAETKALQDAKLRISGYILEIVEGKYTEAFRYKNEKGYINENSDIINAFSWSYTQNILEGIKPLVSLPEHYSDGSMEIQILVSVFKDDIDRKRNEIDKQMTNLSVYYTSEIKNQAVSSLETLRKYEQIVSKLSPLERLLVNFLGLAEPVNLYSYLTDQIRKLSAEIVIKPGTKEYFFGTWVSTVEYKKSFDTYEINFSSDGRSCSVRIKNDKAEQVATGDWSLDGDVFKLEAVFRNPVITYQRNIDWKYFVKYGGSNSFNIIGRAATDGPLVRFTFYRQSYF